MDEKLSRALDPAENKINEFNKKAMGIGWNIFKQSFVTASEPFFRKAMGERYFDGRAFVGGLMLWILGTLAAYAFPQFRSAVGLLTEIFNHPSWGAIFRNTYVTVGVGAAMCLLHYRWGMESLNLMAQYRINETPYHTRSRGIPRWGESQWLAPIVIVTALLVFNLPVAVLFIAAMITNANIRAEQQAAIMSRYLDAMDRELENKNLEDAALGKAPTEMTFLHQPISEKYKPEMRSNIAASLVGKPVKIVARAPQPKAIVPQPKPEETISTQPSKEPAVAPQIRETSLTPKADERTSQPNEEAGIKFVPPPEFDSPPARKPIDLTELERWAHLGVLIRKSVISLVMLAFLVIAAYGAFRFIQYHWPAKPPASATTETQPNSTTSAQLGLAPAIQNPAPTAPAQVFRAAENNATTPLRALSEHVGGVKAELQAFEEFTNYVRQTFNAEYARALTIPKNKLPEGFVSEFKVVKEACLEVMDYEKDLLKNLQPNNPADEAAIKSLPPMLASRQSVTNALLRLHQRVDAVANQ